MTGFRVDSWEPAYGSSADDLTESQAEVVPDVEIPPQRWAPVDPGPAPPPSVVLFADGVRRLDARVWCDPAGAGVPEPGVCASLAAGVVCSCPQGAHPAAVQMQRVVAATRPDLDDVTTMVGTYVAQPVTRPAGAEPSSLVMQRVQSCLVGLETRTIREARRPGSGCHAGSDDLLVVDGPLRVHADLPRAVGLIKAHHAVYLPQQLNLVVARLAPGQRTAIFGLGTRWRRYSWYLRLPGQATGWWAGVVRLEASEHLDLAAVRRLADQTARILPRYASADYKDARAPQNLYPVAGLERHLRRRLADPALVQRALRTAGTRPSRAPLPETTGNP